MRKSGNAFAVVPIAGERCRIGTRRPIVEDSAWNVHSSNKDRTRIQGERTASVSGQGWPKVVPTVEYRLEDRGEVYSTRTVVKGMGQFDHISYHSSWQLTFRCLSSFRILVCVVRHTRRTRRTLLRITRGDCDPPHRNVTINGQARGAYARTCSNS